MRFSAFGRYSLSILLSILLWLTMSTDGAARERGPRVQVDCPFPPIAVKVAQKAGETQVLAYELHITNFDVVALTLKQLEVYGDGNKAQRLATISGDALSALMSEVGSSGTPKNPQLIDPGRRALIFLWVELALGTPLPRSLSHRMVFLAESPAPETNAQTPSTLEDFPVPVNQETVPVLSPPFDGGIWLAGDGPGNDSGHRRAIPAIDGHIHSPERFAADWLKVGPNGDSHHDEISRNENWWGYGETIHAVAEGEVIQVVDGIPDNTPRILPKQVTLDNIAGNYVIVRISPNRYVTYAHLQPGSIKVALREHVSRGAVIARLGNSGQATAPHLHLQLTDANSVLQSEGVPFIFSSFTDLGPGSEYELDKHVSIPRTNAIPGQDEVVELATMKK
jgi:murein DD-endopeptidase MepM/ murein hydrolase activator NlpD